MPVMSAARRAARAAAAGSGRRWPPFAGIGSGGGGARRGVVGLGAARVARLDRVEAAAVAGDDAIELGQRLDLVDDHAAHLGGAVGGLLRQFEDALAQLAARGLELAAASRRSCA